MSEKPVPSEESRVRPWRRGQPQLFNIAVIGSPESFRRLAGIFEEASLTSLESRIAVGRLRFFRVTTEASVKDKTFHALVKLRDTAEIKHDEMGTIDTAEILKALPPPSGRKYFGRAAAATADSRPPWQDEDEQ